MFIWILYYIEETNLSVDKMKKSIENIVNHVEVSEKAIEKYLFSQVKELGGVCLKYSNPNMAGYPDRVVLLPGGKTIWVELKSKGKKPTALQQIRIGSMKLLGHHVFVIDDKETVDIVLQTIKAL